MSGLVLFFMVGIIVVIILVIPVWVLMNELLIRCGGEVHRTGCSIVAAMLCPGIIVASVAAVVVAKWSLERRIVWGWPWDTIAAFAAAALLAWLAWKAAKSATTTDSPSVQLRRDD